MDDALGLMEEMKTQGLMPDKATYNSAMYACGKAQRPDRALELLREMQVSEGVMFARVCHCRMDVCVV